MLPEKNVINLIPQRAPFVMISELMSTDERFTRSRFEIEEDNVLTENGVFSEAGLAENVAQTAAARAGYQAIQQNRPVEVGFITVIKNLEVMQLPKAGQTIITEIEIQDQILTITSIKGKIWRDKELIAQCEMSIMIQQPDEDRV